jgi:transposase
MVCLGDHEGMKPYSEDLRVRIVRAAKEGMSKSGAAHLFGVGLSSVERHARMSDRGASLAPRKGGGRPPDADDIIRIPLEEDVMERPAVTIRETRRFLESTTGKSLSLPMFKRL